MVVAIFGGIAMAAPLVATHDPLEPDLLRTLEGPSGAHLLGTDSLGRDVFSRLVYGSRLSLGAAVMAALLVVVIGVAVGLLSGVRGGWVDSVCMRVVDGLLAFPSLVIVLAIAGTLGSGLFSIIVGMAAVSWAGYARLVRGTVLQLRGRPYIEAARAAGASSTRVAVHHILPNVVGPVVVLLTLEMGTFIIAVSTLSFLGVGARPPAPEWGTMLSEGRRFLLSSPNQMLFPGAAITLVVLGFNLLGESVRDVIDPKSHLRAAPLRRRRRRAVAVIPRRSTRTPPRPRDRVGSG